MGKLIATASCTMKTVTMTKEGICEEMVIIYFTSRNLKHKTFQIYKTIYQTR